jgi:hypothetical protein
MRLLIQMQILIDEIEALQAVEELPILIELRSARMLAHMLKVACPGARILQLVSEPDKMVCGHVMDAKANLLADDIYDLEDANDLEWLAGNLTVGGAWRNEAEVEAPEGQIWMDLERALSIRLEGDEP